MHLPSDMNSGSEHYVEGDESGTRLEYGCVGIYGSTAGLVKILRVGTLR